MVEYEVLKPSKMVKMKAVIGRVKYFTFIMANKMPSNDYNGGISSAEAFENGKK